LNAQTVVTTKPTSGLYKLVAQRTPLRSLCVAQNVTSLLEK
jgi:hypothetical protein